MMNPSESDKQPPPADDEAARKLRRQRRKARLRKELARRAAITPCVPDAPYWVPTGCSWVHLPQGIRRAVPEILAPAYKRFVTDAPGELERAVGVTFVHLMWLEICDQVKMADDLAMSTTIPALVECRENELGRHLELLAAKCSTADLLLRLRMVQEMFPRQPLPPVEGDRCFPSSLPAES